MKINVISDLHLEFSDLELPGGEVLILSGDVCEAKHVNAEYDVNNILNEGGPATGNMKRMDRWTRFFHEECSKYDKVFYVVGNHEHYGYTYHKTVPHLKTVLPANITVLEKECVEYNGVLFLGATLWTDMNNHDQLTLYHMKSMMNDYRQITMLNEVKSVYHRLTPEHTVAEHVKTKQLFRHYLEENRRRETPLPVVVLTHHSPSKASTHPHYANDTIMNGAYSSELSEFILDNPEIKLWTHGHTHHNFEYKIGDTTVMCNPRGYAGYEQQAREFDPTRGFEI
jgi:Icc-related predicted phosphoesterase